MATIVRKLGPRSHSTFFFSTDPLTNDGALGAISDFPRSAPLWDPPVRTSPFSYWHELALKFDYFRKSLWVLEYPLYCHQMITQTYPRGDRRAT